MALLWQLEVARWELTYNRRMLRRTILLVLAIATATAFGIAQVPQGPQSQGAIQNRPGANRKPEFPAPSIIDYKPESTPRMRSTRSLRRWIRSICRCW